MLQFLKIQHLAIIDEATLELEPGFVCLTGESGAGKSILIDALMLLSGARASAEMLRSGCEKAVVEGAFELDRVPQDMDLLDGSQLILRREITRDGKSRAFVNGVMVSNTLLADYGELAFELHGQHGHQRLLLDKFHLRLFDEHNHLGDYLEAFQARLAEWRAEYKAYWQEKEQESDRARELSLLGMQIAEIQAAKPSEDDLDLDLRLKQARNRETIQAIRHELSGLVDDRLVGDLRRAVKLARQLGEFEPKFLPYPEQLEAAGATLADLGAEARVLDSFEDESLLTKLEQRENQLNRLFMKYGHDVSEVLSELQRLKQRAAQLSNMSAGLDSRWKDIERLYSEVGKARDALDQARVQSSIGFVERVLSGLRELAFNRADFQVEYHWPQPPASLPAEANLNYPQPEFRFLFSANPDEPAKPLSKIASGGELSRVLLALINAFQRPWRRLLVFDEIDAGLGGETANAVGAKLHELGLRHQVLCVTHFAQVARFANQQIKIEKGIRDERTVTSLIVCGHEERIAELARLMGGDANAEHLRDHARQLIEQAP